MKPGSSARFLVPLLLAAALAGCRNDGAGPAVSDDKAATLTAPGSGAGNSSTGPADAAVKPERNSPGTTTTPSR